MSTRYKAFLYIFSLCSLLISYACQETQKLKTPENIDKKETAHNNFNIREGSHDLSLQWISWTHFGKVQITALGKNWYQIKGEQRSKENDDYLIIDGKFEAISDLELHFEGKVEHQIDHLNQGKPCLKTGKQIFLSTKNRKYWRMQNMQNCEGGMVTDYIDIYF